MDRGGISGGGSGAGDPRYFLEVSVMGSGGGDRWSVGGRHRPILKGTFLL